MGTIADAKSKMPAAGIFLTQDERDQMYRNKTPFFIKHIGERTSQFQDEKTGQKKLQWVLTCVRAEGGDAWQLSMSKNSYRDPLMDQLIPLLQTDEFKLKGIGPVVLAKYKIPSNGNLAWTIEDWEQAPTPAPTPVAQNGTASAKCVACGETAVGVPIQMGDDRFVPHDCKKDKKKVLLPVSK